MSRVGAVAGGDAISKLEAMERNLARMGRALVAYSGGVDSTFLLWAALEVFGPQHVLAATAHSPIIAGRDVRRAQRGAFELGARHLHGPTQALSDPALACFDHRDSGC